MSEDNRDMPDDLDASQSSDSSDSQKDPDPTSASTPDTGPDSAADSTSDSTLESTFDQELDELNSAMVSGALANKLRGRLQRHTEEVREELATDREAREYVEVSGSWGDSATPSKDESSNYESSQNTRDFLASLDERFPGVSRRSEDEDVDVPPPPPGSEETDSDDEGAAGKSAAGAAGKAGAALGAGAAATAAGAANLGKQVADKSRDYASKSKTFFSQTAERIAKKAAEAQEQRREKREAKRQAEEEAQRLAAEEAKQAEDAQQAEREAQESEERSKLEEDPTSFDAIVYSGLADDDRPADSADSPDSTGESETGIYPYPPAPAEEERYVEWHSFDEQPEEGVELRRSGDTDHLEPVDSKEPQQVKFTRKGAPILKLPAGTRVVKNSMQSVRSTVNALNAGERIDPTRPTIALFAVLVLVAGVLSSTTLLGTNKLSPHTSAFFDETKQTQQTQETEATEEEPEEEQQAPQQATGPAPEIASIEVVSYNNDGGDHQEWAEYMTDGDIGTRWQSRYFAQPDLPEGNTIRLIIKLKQETTVSGVTFNGPLDGGQVDLRINDGTDPFGTPVVTSSQMSGTTTLQASEPVVGNTVTLNFVSLPTEDEGRYRVKIDELSVQ